MMGIYYEYVASYQNKGFLTKCLNFYDKFIENYLIYIMLIFVYLKKLEKNHLTNHLFLLSIAVFLIILSENYFLDQTVIFYSLFLGFVVINFIDYFKQNKINIRLF